MPQSPQSGTRTRDLLGYAGSPPDPRWPGGARVAVSIVVNFEEGAEFSVTDGDPENEAVYEIEQRLAGGSDPAIDSHFEYGSRAGWWRIMEVLGQFGAARSAARSVIGARWALAPSDVAPRPLPGHATKVSVATCQKPSVSAAQRPKRP